MRWSILALAAALILGQPGVARAASSYRVSVTRVDQDLYRDSGSGLYLRTRYCYEYAYGADAILVWDGPGSWSNRLLFESGGDCDVVGLFR
jgi:hypothetical protein